MSIEWEKIFYTIFYGCDEMKKIILKPIGIWPSKFVIIAYKSTQNSDKVAFSFMSFIFGMLKT